MSLNKKLLGVLLALLVVMGCIVVAGSWYFRHLVNSSDGRNLLRALVQQVVSEFDPETKVRLDGTHCSFDYKITMTKMVLQSSRDRNATLTLSPVVIDIKFLPYIFLGQLRIAVRAQVPDSQAKVQVNVTSPLTVLFTNDMSRVDGVTVTAQYTAIPLRMLLKFFIHEITLKTLVLDSTDVAANLDGEVTIRSFAGAFTRSEITGHVTNAAVTLKQQQLALRFNDTPYRIAVTAGSWLIATPISLMDSHTGVTVAISGALRPAVDLTLAVNAPAEILTRFNINQGDQELQRSYQQGNGVVRLIVH